MFNLAAIYSLANLWFCMEQSRKDFFPIRFEWKDLKELKPSSCFKFKVQNHYAPDNTYAEVLYKRWEHLGFSFNFYWNGFLFPFEYRIT